MRFKVFTNIIINNLLDLTSYDYISWLGQKCRVGAYLKLITDGYLSI